MYRSLDAADAMRIDRLVRIAFAIRVPPWLLLHLDALALFDAREFQDDSILQIC